VATLDLGILVSGNGSNLQAILDAVRDGSLDARVRLVVSNKPDAPALERAARAGAPRRAIAHRDFPTREAFDLALVEALNQAGVSWVVLAGFMRVLTPVFLEAFRGRIVNIHPSLLPAFPGVRAQRQALDYGVKVAGCTVHFVDAGVDTGPIIGQRAVLVSDDDDESSLAARILVEEHALLVDALRALCEERVELLAVEGNARRRVRVRSK
jgi:phosphoribosylglycinamide formyltransferase 1